MNTLTSQSVATQTPCDDAEALQRSFRYFVRSGKSISALVARKDYPQTQKLETTVIDLSNCGVRLAADTMLNCGESVLVRLSIAELDMDIERTAVVLWSRPRGATEWQIGCTIDSDLSTELLEELTAKRIVERRSEQREDIDFQLYARWEGDPDVTSVQTVNISQGGICIRCPQPCEDGTRLKLYAKDPSDAVTARSRWGSEVKGGYLIGCEMITRGGHARVREWATTSPADIELPANWSTGLWHDVVYQSAALLAITIAGVLLFFLS